MVQPPSNPASRSKRRSFDWIRNEILSVLAMGRVTVNEISKKTEINWKTVDNHLVYLCGRGWAAKVFDSPSIKIFELTDEGREHIERTRRREASLKTTIQKRGIDESTHVRMGIPAV